MYLNIAMLTGGLLSFIFVNSTCYSALRIQVSVPWLLELVVKHSDDIARQKNSLSAVEASTLSINSRLDSRFGMTISHFEDDNERSNGSTLGKLSVQKASINLSKSFSTGTMLSAEVNSSINEQEMATVTPLVSQTNESKESEFSVELRQSLLKNSFGHAHRASIDAAESAKLAKKHLVEETIESYLEVLIDQYFTIWTAFNQLASSEERYKRELRRKKIYDRQYNRGFIEKIDILQIDSSILSAEKNLSDAKQLISGLLIKLGTIVKMDLYNQYIGKKISFKFALEKIDDVEKLCSNNRIKINSFISETYSNRIQSFNAKLAAISSNGKPEVYFATKITANGIDDETKNSLSEASSFKHPQYLVSLGIDMFIGRSANQADKLEALKSRSENQILLAQEKANLTSDWLETCNSLRMTSLKKQYISKKLDLDSERIKLLDQDFRLGKTDLGTLLQAEDTLTNTKSSLSNLSAKLFNTAWHLRKQSGQLRTFVSSAIGR
ncbi:MAG: TolC family protein [Oligoflexales bacterium]